MGQIGRYNLKLGHGWPVSTNYAAGRLQTWSRAKTRTEQVSVDTKHDRRTYPNSAAKAGSRWEAVNTGLGASLAEVAKALAH